jgi:hypothetical protein
MCESRQAPLGWVTDPLSGERTARLGSFRADLSLRRFAQLPQKSLGTRNRGTPTFGFSHGRSDYEPESGIPLDYVGHGFKRFSANRDRLESVGLLALFLVPTDSVTARPGDPMWRPRVAVPARR